MLRKMVPQIALMSVSVAAVLAMLVGLANAPEHSQRSTREQGEAHADRLVRASMSFDHSAVSPAVKDAAQWFGLCSAYTATTIAGFKAQLTSDPQLMEQYKNFDWSNAVIIANPQDWHGSVLYRKNGKIYWTRKPLLIKKGEKILTDGNVQIRTYCCNQIALAPPGPFLPPPSEPPPEEIQPPEAPAIPELPPIPPTAAIPPSLTTFIPAPLPPPRRLFIKERRSRAPTPVPEPGALILLVSGLGIFALLRRLR